MNDLITALYARFNARDIDGVLAHLAPDVDWPNAWEGGRVHGHHAVREYWTRQWTQIDGIVEPAQIDVDGNTVTVHVDQTVKDLDGNLLSESRVKHVYEFDDDGLVARMDVED
jgi:ketosteroid isomerase-like protein